jgi:PAS domain-containing protein
MGLRGLYERVVDSLAQDSRVYSEVVDELARQEIRHGLEIADLRAEGDRRLGIQVEGAKHLARSVSDLEGNYFELFVNAVNSYAGRRRGYFVLDANQEVVAMSPRLGKVFGYEPSEDASLLPVKARNALGLISVDTLLPDLTFMFKEGEGGVPGVNIAPVYAAHSGISDTYLGCVGDVDRRRIARVRTKARVRNVDFLTLLHLNKIDWNIEQWFATRRLEPS